MTSQGSRLSPATRGSASLSPAGTGRFPPHWRYRAAQNYPSSRYVAIVDHAAAFAGPTPDGEGELPADVATVRADARAARKAPVDTPRSPRPLGLVAEGSQKPSQPRVGQRTRHPSSHQPAQAQIFNGEPGIGVDQNPGRLVHRIAPGVGERAVSSAEARNRAAAVDAALSPPVTLTVQTPDALGCLPGEAGMRDACAVAQGGEVDQATIDADLRARRGSVNLLRGFELDRDVPAFRLLRHGDLFQIGGFWQRHSAHTKPANLRKPDASGLDTNIAADEREGIRPIRVSLEAREAATRLPLALGAIAQRAVETLNRHLRGPVGKPSKARIFFQELRQPSRHLGVENELALCLIAFDVFGNEQVPQRSALPADAGHCGETAAVEPPLGGLHDKGGHANNSRKRSRP